MQDLRRLDLLVYRMYGSFNRTREATSGASMPPRSKKKKKKISEMKKKAVYVMRGNTRGAEFGGNARNMAASLIFVLYRSAVISIIIKHRSGCFYFIFNKKQMDRTKMKMCAGIRTTRVASEPFTIDSLIAFFSIIE